jgi:hypothetical protein
MRNFNKIKGTNASALKFRLFFEQIRKNGASELKPVVEMAICFSSIRIYCVWSYCFQSISKSRLLKEAGHPTTWTSTTSEWRRVGAMVVGVGVGLTMELGTMGVGRLWGTTDRPTTPHPSTQSSRPERGGGDSRDSPRSWMVSPVQSPLSLNLFLLFLLSQVLIPPPLILCLSYIVTS